MLSEHLNMDNNNLEKKVTKILDIELFNTNLECYYLLDKIKKAISGEFQLTNEEKRDSIRKLSTWLDNYSIEKAQASLLNTNDVSKCVEILGKEFDVFSKFPFLISQLLKIIPNKIFPKDLNVSNLPNVNVFITLCNVFSEAMTKYQFEDNYIPLLERIIEKLDQIGKIVENIRDTKAILDILIRQYDSVRYQIGRIIQKCRSEIQNGIPPNSSLEKILVEGQNKEDLMKHLNELELRRLMLHHLCELIGNPSSLRAVVEKLETKITILSRSKEFYDKSDSEIHGAVARYWLPEFEALLSNGIDVNKWNSWGQPIHYISIAAHTTFSNYRNLYKYSLKMAHQLFKAGSILQYNNGSRENWPSTWGIGIEPIRMILNNGLFALAIIYCANGYDIIESPEHFYNGYSRANSNNWASIISKYIVKNMNLETGILNKKALRKAYEFYKKIESGEMLSSANINHDCLLWLVAMLGDLKIIEAVDNFKSDFNKVIPIVNFTPLMMAVYCGNEEVVDFLIRNGAKIDVQFQTVDPHPFTNGDNRKHGDARLNTPSHLLFLAIEHKHFIIAKNLVQSGIEPIEEYKKIIIEEKLEFSVKIDPISSPITHKLPDKFECINQTIVKETIENLKLNLKLIRKKRNNIDDNILSNIEQQSRNVNSPISFNLKYSALEIGKELGRGAFGIVYQGIYCYNEVAIKQLHLMKPSEEALIEFKKEMELMARLRCPQIVQLYGVYTEPTYGIVMEYMPNGSLYSVLHGKQTLEWSVRTSIAVDITKGVAFLHSENILHRDLKSLNVLLDKHMNAKLTDFGLAKIKTETASTASSNNNQVAGTLLWMAPELFKRRAQCTQKSDMYSLGMTLWELASRELPFKDASNQAIARDWIEKGEREVIPNDTPPKVSKLITFCWNADAAKRPTADEAVKQLISAELKQEQTESATFSYQGNFDSENQEAQKRRLQEQIHVLNRQLEEQSMAQEQGRLKRQQQLDGFLNEGIALKAANRFSEALQIFEQALVLEPDRADIIQHKADALYHSGYSVEALIQYTICIDRAQSDRARAGLLINRAHPLYDLKNYKAAYEDFRRAKILWPENTAYDSGMENCRILGSSDITGGKFRSL